jgi:HAD superfamily hydrolase (TIGR01509 family)
MNILVTCGGGFQGLTLYKEISLYPHVKSFLIDIHEENVSKYFFDYFSLCPPVLDKDKYISFIFEYCRSNDINIIIPATTYDLDILSEISDSLRSQINCYAVVPDMKFVNIFKNKRLTYEFLEQHRISVQQVLDPLISNDYPMIGKPKAGWGGRGLTVIYSVEDFLHKINPEDRDNYIWVKYLEKFTEYSVDFSINFQYHASDIIIRDRKSTSGGFAVITEQESMVHRATELIVQKIVDIFINNKIVGLFNIQLLYLDEHTIYCSDVNPRIGTSAIIHKIGKRGLIGNFLCQNEEPIGVLANSNNHSVKAVRYLSELYIKKIKRSIKGIVFDLDDTLISNKEFIIARCQILYNQLSDLFGDYSTYLVNISLLLNEGYAPYLIDKLCDLYGLLSMKRDILKIYRDGFPDKVSVYADVEPTLNAFKANHFKLFVLTDNPVVTQKVKWNVFPFRDMFDDVIFTNNYGLSKPDSKCFHIISETHGIAPEDLVMIGDNQVRDIVGAIHAGYNCAFHIVRDNAMVTSHLMAYSNIDISKVHHIKSLKEVPYYFS